MTITTTDAETRISELWAELGELYAGQGLTEHFEIVRRIDRAYFDEQARAGAVNADQARRFAESQAAQERWESAHPEEARRRREAAENQKARQMELDRKAAESWAAQFEFPAAERAELLAAVSAGEDVLSVALRIRERRGTVEDRLAAIEERLTTS